MCKVIELKESGSGSFCEISKCKMTLENERAISKSHKIFHLLIEQTTRKFCRTEDRLVQHLSECEQRMMTAIRMNAKPSCDLKHEKVSDRLIQIASNDWLPVLINDFISHVSICI